LSLLRIIHKLVHYTIDRKYATVEENENVHSCRSECIHQSVDCPVNVLKRFDTKIEFQNDGELLGESIERKPMNNCSTIETL